MLRVIVFACFILFYFNLNAAPAVTFIEFTPIAAISNGYSFGISEIKVNKHTIYTISFKKEKMFLQLRLKICFVAIILI